MSDRPHEHYYFDQVGHGIYIVVCATCEAAGRDATIGTVPDIGDTYLPLANQHWREEVLHGGRHRATTGLRDPRQ